jgi:hypothetical protein
LTAEVFVSWSISYHDWAGDACHGSPDVEEVTMSTSTTRVFTRSRVVALMLIALLVGGLVYLRFAPNSDTVSVPGVLSPAT